MEPCLDSKNELLVAFYMDLSIASIATVHMVIIIDEIMFNGYIDSEKNHDAVTIYLH